MNKFSLKNKNVLITGASSGIGAACAKKFAEAGANLILCSRRLDRLEKTANELKNLFNTRIYYSAIDIRNYANLTNFFSEFPEEFKDIDVLVNNAGLALGLDKIQEGNVTEWQQMLDTNVNALLYTTRLALPNMITRNQGHIINIGSISGHGVYPNGVVYCATKHAVRAISQGLRMDLLGTKVRVSIVEPGMVETEFSLVRLKNDIEAARKPYQGMQPLSPEDIADAVFYCANAPLHVNIDEVILMPTAQASLTMVHREDSN